LTGAIDLAKEQNCEKATPEHILIAMMEEGTGVANRLLNHFKIDQDKLTESLSK
jgi:ATP-dependent Clp protease ATP-binding subunit ClpA